MNNRMTEVFSFKVTNFPNNFYSVEKNRISEMLLQNCGLMSSHSHRSDLGFLKG